MHPDSNRPVVSLSLEGQGCLVEEYKTQKLRTSTTQEISERLDTSTMSAKLTDPRNTKKYADAGREPESCFK